LRALLIILFLLPQAMVALKNAAISISSFLLNKCGTWMGSDSMNLG